MKKVIAFVLSFFMVFLNLNISKALGDPLDDNPSWYEKLREEFRWIEYQKGSQSPAIFTAKNSSNIWSHDYRTCRVYNFPKLVGSINSNLKEEDAFLPCMTRIYKKANEVYSKNEKLGRYFGEKAFEIFREDFSEEIKYSKEMKFFKEFLGADDKTVVDAMICSLGLEICAKLAYGVAALAGIAAALYETIVVPTIGLTVTAGAAAVFLQRATFASQRAKNAALLIRGVYGQLNEPDDLGDVNVLITAIDERDFTSLLPWNAFRRDDGIWYGLRHINNLSCAPMGKLYADRLKKYLQDYNNLFNGNNLAPEKIIEMGKKSSDRNKRSCPIQ